ncbi:MAG: energy-coupling factor ABC transporter permease [Burkholderiales bacterium]|jgi:uncharacterized membrane protein
MSPVDTLPSPLESPLLALIALAGAAVLARGANWRGLVTGGRLNLWLGATVVLMLLWRMRAGAQPDLEMHLAGATVAYLMFGLRLGGVALACAALGAGLAADRSLPAIGTEWLLHGMLPLWVSAALVSMAERRLPAHPFIFLWGYGFFVSGIAVCVGGLAQTLWHAGLGSTPWAVLSEEFLPFYLLLGGSEAFTAGALLTLMVVYRPGWVERFDDAVYLRRGP